MQCLEEAEQQAEAVSMFLILHFKLLSQFPFVSFLSISIFSGAYAGGGGGGGVQGVQVNPPFFKLIIFIACLDMHV